MASKSAINAVRRPFIPRDTFPEYTVNLSNFQGHHKKALNKMAMLAPQVDLVLELRDARVPLSSINTLFDKVLKGKPKLILYTKTDISNINPELFKFWHPEGNYRALDGRSGTGAISVFEFAKKQYETMVPPPPLGMKMLVTGMPNAGKSTFLNTLRRVGMREKHKVARTGDQPGVTRNISTTIRISKDPDIFIFDTPGVFIPRVDSAETMIKLCLSGTVGPSHVEPIAQADYLLYMYNKQYPDGSAYKSVYDKPVNYIEPILRKIAKDAGLPHKDREIDQRSMSNKFIKMWRTGKLPPLVLDDLSTGKAPDSVVDRFKDFRIQLSDVELKKSKHNRRNLSVI